MWKVCKERDDLVNACFGYFMEHFYIASSNISHRIMKVCAERYLTALGRQSAKKSVNVFLKCASNGKTECFCVRKLKGTKRNMKE